MYFHFAIYHTATYSQAFSMDSPGQHFPVMFHIQFSILVIIMILFIILDSHYHPPWPLIILHDHHPILQDDHDQGVSLRHCLALGGGLVTGWGVAQTALHYYWFRWWGIVMIVWHSLMLVQTMRMNWWRGSWWWLIDDHCDNCCHRASLCSLFSISSTFLPLFLLWQTNTLFFEPRGSA